MNAIRTKRELLRRVGRALLWSAVALVLVRGTGSILAEEGKVAATGRPAVVAAGERFLTAEVQAFAVSFARAYLSFAAGRQEWVAAALRPYLSPALSDDAGLRVPAEGPSQVVQGATVARVARLNDRDALVTVAVTVASATVRTRYLTVPVGRDARGALAVYDLPSFASPPMRAELPEPVGDDLERGEREAVEDVLGRFFPVFFAGRGGASELDYFLPAGRHLRALEERFRFRALHSVQAARGVRHGGLLVLAAVEVQDAESGARHELRYRVALERRERWYVRGLNAA